MHVCMCLYACMCKLYMCNALCICMYVFLCMLMNPVIRECAVQRYGVLGTTYMVLGDR